MQSLDYRFGLQDIIPSVNNRKTPRVRAFKEVVKTALTDVNKYGSFPTKQPVLLVIIQFFKSKNDFDRHDVDNICKVMLDSMKLILYEDDAQVNTVVVSKQCDKKIPDNFVYVGIKISNPGENIGLIDIGKRDARALFANALEHPQTVAT